MIILDIKHFSIGILFSRAIDREETLRRRPTLNPTLGQRLVLSGHT